MSAKTMLLSVVLAMVMLTLAGCSLSPPSPTSTPTKRPDPAVLGDSSVHWWVCGFFGDDCAKCSKSGPTLRGAGISTGTELERTGETLSCYGETDMNGEEIGTTLAGIEDPRSGQSGTIWVPMSALD